MTIFQRINSCRRHVFFFLANVHLDENKLAGFPARFTRKAPTLYT